MALFGETRRAALRILQGAEECENFKIYSTALKALFEDKIASKKFIEAHPEDLYSQDGGFIFPANRADIKGGVISYSEIANLLYISRPYEIKRHLLNCPDVAHYNLSWRTTWQHIPKSARTILCYSMRGSVLFESPAQISLQQLMDYGLISHQTDIVYIMHSPKMNEIEKYITEGKTMIAYSIESWPTEVRNSLISQLSKKSSIYSVGYKPGSHSHNPNHQLAGADSFTSMNSIGYQNAKSTTGLHTGYGPYFGGLSSQIYQNTRIGKTGQIARLIVICNSPVRSRQSLAAPASTLCNLPKCIDPNSFDAVLNLETDLSLRKLCLDMVSSILHVPLK